MTKKQNFLSVKQVQLAFFNLQGLFNFYHKKFILSQVFILNLTKLINERLDN